MSATPCPSSLSDTKGCKELGLDVLGPAESETHTGMRIKQSQQDHRLGRRPWGHAEAPPHPCPCTEDWLLPGMLTCAPRGLQGALFGTLGIHKDKST